MWSAMQTLGLNNRKWLPRLKTIANVLSTIIVLVFMSVPLYYLAINIF
jgi:succinate dehydrogenase / fumarate reductase cytochrome b subunit